MIGPLLVIPINYIQVTKCTNIPPISSHFDYPTLFLLNKSYIVGLMVASIICNIGGVGVTMKIQVP